MLLFEFIVVIVIFMYTLLINRLHGTPKSEERNFVKEIKFDDLLQHFQSIQAKHKRVKQAGKASELIHKGMKAVKL